MANYKPLTDVRYIVVHCAATPAKMDIGAKEIDLWHRQRGFLRIGYHMVIRRNGVTEPGRPLDMPGAHVLHFNDVSLGVCMVGGVDKGGPEGKPENNFMPEQFETLHRVLSEWKALHPQAAIIGHRDLDPGKACPSFDVAKWAEPLGLLK